MITNKPNRETLFDPLFEHFVVSRHSNAQTK